MVDFAAMALSEAVLCLVLRDVAMTMYIYLYYIVITLTKGEFSIYTQYAHVKSRDSPRTLCDLFYDPIVVGGETFYVVLFLGVCVRFVAHIYFGYVCSTG